MHIPNSTYRIQFNSSFGFRNAIEIINYLSDLGISCLYASPIFKARKGSRHGYDIVDPNLLNPDLGKPEDFENLICELKKNNLTWLQDIVPNHMAYDSQNQILMDVLEKGKYSNYIDFFDIDWSNIYEDMNEKVLTPLLGKFYAEALENKEIQLKYDEKGFSINYYDLSLPLKVSTYIQVLESNIDALEKKLSGQKNEFFQFLGVINLFKTVISGEGDFDKSKQINHAKIMLWSVYDNNLIIKQVIDENIAFFNGEKGTPSSFDMLDELILKQHYRLSFWKVAAEEINYRRFFTVNELISLKIENEKVFDYTHSLILKLIKEGKIDALRIDHIDGLNDPFNYLKRLREKSKDIFIVVEKILAQAEKLPECWPIQGTTGYEFMNYVNGVFCMKENKEIFNKIYKDFTNINESFEDLLCGMKRIIISRHLAGNIDNLAHLLKKISSKDRYGRDITLYGLKRAFVEVMANFPVYRTYIDFDSNSENDMQYIKKSIIEAKKKAPGFFHEIGFIEKFLLLKYDENLAEETKNEWITFVMSFQQFTGPLMAKGFEDTMLYIYNRLISLNDVGGFPEKFGVSVEELHNFSQKKNAFKYSLNTTSTHDTKRGEDVRARINVLSEIPEEWRVNLNSWLKINEKIKTEIDGVPAPDNNDEYFIYQTLLGSFPFRENIKDYKERIKAYIIKAVRESKRHTAWIKPDYDYENACVSFVEGLLKDDQENQFLKEFLPFQKKIAYYGIHNSLSQTLIKITSPGIADFYQGTELWDLNLVDPDNRRPVDFKKRIEFFKGIKNKSQEDPIGLINELFENKEDGRVKMYLIYKLLNAKKQMADLFQKGMYIPLKTEGKNKDHIIAFARQYSNKWAITIAPRFFTSLIKEDKFLYEDGIWDDTFIMLPKGFPVSWRDVITGEDKSFAEKIFINQILRYFPVSLLANKL